MSELIVAVGLVFVIEGLLWALFPGYLTKLLEAAHEMSELSLRRSGAFAVALGVLIVWFVRG